MDNPEPTESRTNIIQRAITASAIAVARIGLIDEARGKRIADIAWPQFVIGLARNSKRTADFIMVGIAVGPAAIAGMGFALAYWSIARGIGFSLANGGMTFMSQRFGADDMEGLDLAFKITFWIELVIASVLMAVFIGLSDTLIGLLDAAPEPLEHGSMYLSVVAMGLVFGVTNQLAASALISANDAWTPMILRAGGAVINLVLNVILIFGLGLGVFGAAIGTVISTFVIFIPFVVGLLRGKLPFIGDLPIQISVTRPFFDVSLTKQILEVGAPLMGRRIVSRAARFPMLAIVAQFGTIIVAGYVASREVRKLMNTPGWGFSTAGRSLVGQELGAGEEQSATAYGWDTLRFAMAVYAVMSVLMFVFNGQIAALFSEDPAAIEATIPFIMVMAVSLLGMGVDGSSSGILSGAGDTRWPLYARFIGLYAFMIPLAYIGIVTPLGILGLYLAVTAETVVPALITFGRFWTGKWIAISRRYRQSPVN